MCLIVLEKKCRTKSNIIKEWAMKTRKLACPTVLAPSSFRSSRVWSVVLLSPSAHLSTGNLWTFHLTNSILFSIYVSLTMYSLKASYFTTEVTSFFSRPLEDYHKWCTTNSKRKSPCNAGGLHHMYLICLISLVKVIFFLAGSFKPWKFDLGTYFKLEILSTLLCEVPTKYIVKYIVICVYRHMK